LPEWLVEQGIGETRAILLVSGEIVAARVQWDEGLLPGQIAEAQVVSLAAGGKRGTARFADSSEGAADTWAFLDRRIGEVMQIEKFKATAQKFVAGLPNPLSILGSFRHPRG